MSSTDEDVVLVTEFVGAPIIEHRSGLLFYEQRKNVRKLLPLQAISAIRAAEIKSLTSIHSCGISHRDIALRNLRLEIKAGENPHNEKNWRACWIDYGRSRTEATSFRKSYEMQMLQCLFAKAEQILSQMM